MTLLGTLLEPRARVVPAQKVSTPISFLTSGMKSATGQKISATSALSSTLVLACARALSETLAMLPLHVIEQSTSRSRRKEIAREHWLYWILHRDPNSLFTSFEWREMMQASLCTFGNAYSEIERNQYGQVVGLWPLRSDMMRLEMKKGSLWYLVTRNGKQFALRPDQVLHFKGFSTYGLVGLCLIDVAKDSVGLALAQQEYAARWFANNAQPGGYLKRPIEAGALDKDGRNLMRKEWVDAHGGLSKVHRMAILEEGTEWKETGGSPGASQLIEGRTFQAADVARIFRMPLHMIQELSKATYSNIEQQAIEFVKYTMQPWVERWEQRLDKALLGGKEKGQYFAKFALDGLLRGDSAARSEFYQKLFMVGAMSQNDIRDLEDMNPIGPAGDTYYVPLNMVPAGSAGSEENEGDADTRSQVAGSRLQVPGREERDADADRIKAAAVRLRLRVAYRGVILDAAKRVVNGEVREVRKALDQNRSRRDVQDFRAWLEDYYHGEGWRGFLRGQMESVFASYAEAVTAAAGVETGAEEEDLPEMDSFLDAYTGAVVTRHSESSLGQLQSLETLDEVEERLDAWVETRPDKIATREVVDLCEAVASSVFLFVGFNLVWRAVGESCPLCQALDGKIVGREGYFVKEGDVLDPGDGETTPLKVRRNKKHPGLHQGCDCFITPG